MYIANPRPQKLNPKPYNLKPYIINIKTQTITWLNPWTLEPITLELV
jgi:hypothetical protein